MKAFDLQRMAFDKVPLEFLGEVALRSLYTFVLVFLFLKITGRRGVRQMSLFEVLIILTLGSAAGDVAFYDDVPMVPVFIVFVSLALLYRLVMWLMSKSEKLEDLLEGKPVVIVEDGQLAWEKVQSANMTEFEFFMELRLNSVEQLGQVRLAIMETNGQISVYYYPDNEVKPGLCILPDMLVERFTTVPETEEYACIKCSHVVAMRAGDHQLCPRCTNPEWTKVSRAIRVT
ncbi:DUF421 domain-containing protein [Salmonella enterica]|jgi:uncharacterized membrane protein YcaP (DUF421 family)|uniref:DUF421 domain-containing protein n=1 Tax=Enterobacteriaceae TaxID=543 RepID=UPI0007B3CBEF|nr:MULTISPECIES: DUF421 domain-containing protein [Enterobacteriaceae]EAP1039183.1 DUF421 domain-containing protein [Salmonella enterica]EBZ7152734.1 DUF421 domain-containing protein [Salmonella enterica subsp. enterica serovar Schwarzengrund]ECO0783183.1 DUF421 domain-containing protein [Salmonella enterica subsp. enterica serovar Senftenberg]ECX5115865.1 DUF421 domain-containing protein [Salmonella enterica subsp. enterica serovar Agona]EDM1520328.1 DUF421 domain-containing protein [Salmonel